jgi:hypothetical protein
MCRPLAIFNLFVVWWRGSSETTPTGFWWLPVFPKKLTVPYGSFSCQNLCAGLTLPLLSTGLWPMVFFVVNNWFLLRLINGPLMVKLMVMVN